MFTLDQRERIAKAATRDIVNLEVISSEGYLYKLAERLSAVALVKGVRNEVDRAYELMMAEYNSAHYPAAKTVLLECEAGLSEISSTLVREGINKNGDLFGYLSPEAIEKINKITENR